MSLTDVELGTGVVPVVKSHGYIPWSHRCSRPHTYHDYDAAAPRYYRLSGSELFLLDPFTGQSTSQICNSNCNRNQVCEFESYLCSFTLLSCQAMSGYGCILTLSHYVHSCFDLPTTYLVFFGLLESLFPLLTSMLLVLLTAVFFCIRGSLYMLFTTSETTLYTSYLSKLLPMYIPPPPTSTPGAPNASYF